VTRPPARARSRAWPIPELAPLCIARDDRPLCSRRPRRSGLTMRPAAVASPVSCSRLSSACSKVRRLTAVYTALPAEPGAGAESARLPCWSHLCGAVLTKLYVGGNQPIATAGRAHQTCSRHRAQARARRLRCAGRSAPGTPKPIVDALKPGWKQTSPKWPKGCKARPRPPRYGLNMGRLGPLFPRRRLIEDRFEHRSSAHPSACSRRKNALFALPLPPPSWAMIASLIENVPLTSRSARVDD